MGKFIKTALVAFMLCFGLSNAAKADAIAPTAGSSTSDTFTGVDIFAVTSTLHPFGVTPIICPGTLVACNQAQFGSAAPIFEVGTVTFFNTGGFTISETTPSGNGNTVSVNQNNSPYLTSLAGYCASAGPSLFSTSAASLSVSTGTECTVGAANGFVYNGNNNGGGSILSYLGNGVFSVTDNSFQIAFQLTNTPEPSSLLMLGSGLLGLLGLGFRRKALV